MAFTPLRLFPSISADAPSQPAFKRPRHPNVKRGRADLSSVTVQATTNKDSNAAVEPASENIQHSLFCDPSPEILASISKNSSKSSLQTPESCSSPVQPQRETRFKTRVNGVHNSPLTGSELSSASEDEQTSSRTAEFRSFSSPPAKQRSRSKQKRVPESILTAPRETATSSQKIDGIKEDQLSPLPHKTQFTPRLRHSPKTPLSSTERGVDSSPGYSTPSSSNPSPNLNVESPPMRSMFPQYNHNKPLSQQQYWPRVSPQIPSMASSDRINEVGGAMEKRSLRHCDSAVGLVDGYEHVPAVQITDLHDIWRASCEELPVTGRKVQLNLHQFSAQGTALAIGRNSDELVYSMDRIDSQTIQQNPSHPKEMAIKKHHPTQKSNLPVAHLLLPDRTLVRATAKPLTSIFPQAAAIDAIESLLTTTKSKGKQALGDDLHSPTAAQSANEAISAAQHQYCCDLVRQVRRRDSLGSVTAAYELRHPSLGTFVITVTKSYSPIAPTVPRAKISLHHPSATPTAIAAETLNLAFLDFASDACVLDLPGLLALDDHYVLDTVVAALLAVAVIENDTLIAEALVFDAPPRVAVSDAKKRQNTNATEGGKSGYKLSRKRDRKSKKAKKKQTAEQVELPMITQGALALLGLSFKAAVLLLNAGVKVTAGVIVGASNAAKKL